MEGIADTLIELTFRPAFREANPKVVEAIRRSILSSDAASIVAATRMVAKPTCAPAWAASIAPPRSWWVRKTASLPRTFPASWPTPSRELNSTNCPIAGMPPRWSNPPRSPGCWPSSSDRAAGILLEPIHST